MAGQSTLGERIAAARVRLDMSQEELGDQIGITGAAVSGWERSKPGAKKKQRPDIEKLPLIRKVLKVPYAWLLEGELPPPPLDDPFVAVDDLVLAQKQPPVAPPAKTTAKPKKRA